MDPELAQELHRKVSELCELGDADVEAGEHDRAILRYEEALSLLPRPIAQWNIATWILTAIGDAHFYGKDYRTARSALDEATRCPRGLENPFIHLRLGQVELLLGNEQRAREELARAYLGAGEEIFEGEDPRYLALAKDAAQARLADYRGKA